MSINYKKLKLPDKPGVYFFLGTSKGGKKGKEILYIGKATSLRDRVRSYFNDDVISSRGPLIVDMVTSATQVDYRETDSVLEALILEAALIKKHKPRYNTKEKDNKSFLSVVITKEPIPRVLTLRSRNLEEHSSAVEGLKISKIYGPFTSGPSLKEALKIIRPIFPFLDEKSKNYHKFYKQIDLVPDVTTKEGVSEYKKNIQNIKLFFEGKKKRILSNLKKDMKVYAKAQAFEKANEVKKKIFALEHINDVALIKEENISVDSYRVEAYDVAHMGGKNMVGVMTVVLDGEPAKGQYKKFKIRTQSNTNDTGALKEILDRRFNHPEWGIPDLVVVDGSTAQINAARGILGLRGIKIDVVSVVKDEKHRPKGLKGDTKLTRKYEREILLANNEAHRFAIAYHKNLRSKNFLK